MEKQQLYPSELLSNCKIFRTAIKSINMLSIWIITNTMHCLSSVYCVITPLHVSDVSAAPHQEVEYTYMCQMVIISWVDCQRAWPDQVTYVLRMIQIGGRWYSLHSKPLGTVKWFRQIIIVLEFLFPSPRRWPHEWMEHVGYYHVLNTFINPRAFVSSLKGFVLPSSCSIRVSKKDDIGRFGPWRWGHYVASKHRDPITHWSNVIWRENGFFSYATLNTSKL
jgi:hypothetical protein